MMGGTEFVEPDLGWMWWSSSLWSVGWLLGIAFWVWMIVDCARNDPERNVWLWIIILVPFSLGAVVYFLARKARTMDLPQIKALDRWTRRRELWTAEAAARNIGNAYQFVVLGELLREFGQRQPAADAFQKALAKEPKNPQALWGLSLCQLQQEQFAAAKEHLQTLLEIDPNYKFGEAYLAYGRALIALGQRAAAGEHLSKNIRRWSYPEAHVLLATILVDEGKTDAARGYLQTVVHDMRAAPDFSFKRNRRWLRKAKSLLHKIGG